jgi:predicted metalloprotease
MRWTPSGRSPDLDDLRGSTGRGGGFGGFGMTPRLGCGGFVVLLLLSLIFRQNFFALLGGGGPPASAPGQQAPVSASPEEEKQMDFVNFVLKDVQGTWEQIFSQSGQQYPHARLAVFRDSVRSGCGFAESAMGPFYCPSDQEVYLDLNFFDELHNRFGAPGDFAQAYVIAHEFGHHVQKVLGISDRVQRAQQSNPSEANALSVRLELQADCLAGVWAHTTQQRNLLEAGDVDEALAAAAAVGDDRIQRQATGGVNPETWTHGSSQDRSRWFHAGFQSGDIQSCDTFR